MAETYIVENVEALWPKIDKTYAFDQSVKRSVPCSPRDQNAEFSIAFRMDSATAKALFMQMKGAYDANKEPKCKLISINNELVFNLYKLETIIKCAEELIGKNSDIP